MKRAVVCLIVGLALLGVVGLAERKTVLPDNPFFKPKVDLYPLIVHYRQTLGIPVLDANVTPISLKTFQFWYLMGSNTQALAQLYETLREIGEVSTLEQLTKISYWSSPRSLFQVLLFFRFPDEKKFADNGFFVIEKPDFWDTFPTWRVK